MGDLKTRYYEVTVTASDLAGNTGSDTCKVVIIPSCNPENDPDSCEEYNVHELPNVEDFYYTRSAVDYSVTQSQVLSQVAQEKLTWESVDTLNLGDAIDTYYNNLDTLTPDIAPTPRKAIYEIVDEIDVIVKDTKDKVDGVVLMKTTVDGMSDTIGITIDASVIRSNTYMACSKSIWCCSDCFMYVCSITCSRISFTS